MRAKKMDDDAIMAVVTAGTRSAVGYSGSRLSAEREKVVRYRDGELPNRAGANDSSFVSLDVYEGIEAMKAQLLEVFAGNKRPVQFDPAPGESSDAANLRTDYVTDVVFAQNRGFKHLQSAIDDGLMGRTSVGKAWWENKKEAVEYDVTGPSYEEIGTFLADNPGAEITEVEEHILDDGDPATGDFKRVRFTVQKDRSQVMLDILAPEEFGISARASSLEDADISFHKQRKSRSDLLKMGFDKAIVETLDDDDRHWSDSDSEVQARFDPTDDLSISSNIENGVGKKTCLLYETYVMLDVAGTGRVSRWKVMHVGDVLLHKEKVSRLPFFTFTPLPRSHSFWGSSYGLQLVPIQNARTYLTRSIINHALITNNPRTMVVKGAVMNPKELLENKYGGIVNVTRPDGLIPFPQAGLNPFVFQTIAMLRENKEEITGISGLSQGMNKDAVSKQNSGDMVHELISVSQIRQKIIARNFAENFLRDLYTLVYELVCENEDREKIVQIAGDWTPVDFTKWPTDTRMSVSFSLGYGEQEKETRKWASVHTFLSSDQSMAAHYGPVQKHAVIRKGLIALGIRDPDTYWLPPDQTKPAGPSPMELADLDVKKADAEVKRANARAALESIQMKAAMHHTKAQIDVAKLQHTVALDGAELELARQIESKPDTKLDARAVISPG